MSQPDNEVDKWKHQTVKINKEKHSWQDWGLNPALVWEAGAWLEGLLVGSQVYNTNGHLWRGKAR